MVSYENVEPPLDGWSPQAVFPSFPGAGGAWFGVAGPVYFLLDSGTGTFWNVTLRTLCVQGG